MKKSLQSSQIRCRAPPFSDVDATNQKSEKEEIQMATMKRIPNYRKMYPTASEEVIEVLRQGERRLRYLEYDIKVERFVLDETKQVAFFIPSREDSLERLIEAEEQFVDEEIDVEDEAINKILIQKLRESLKCLDSEEFDLINALFFQGKTVRQLSTDSSVPVMTIQDRKVRVLKKLKKILGN